MLSIIVPAFNEEKRLPKTLEELTKLEAEIIVINDGSTDNTLDIAKTYNVRVVSYQKNRGKGYAVRQGLKEAKGDRILFTDSDLSTPIKELDTFLRYDHDLLIASRDLKGSSRVKDQPLFRKIIGLFCRILVSMITIRGFKDTQCGFKLMKKDLAKLLVKKMRIDGFAFDIEMIYLAKKYGFSIKELPVRWIDNDDSRVDPVKDSLKMFRDLFIIRINDLLGKY